MHRIAISITVLALLAACGGGTSQSQVEAPGADESPKIEALDAGAAVLQDKPPIEALNAYLDGFHFYNGRMADQMEAHHYCATLGDDVIQCVIYDGNTRDAKIMGVEYIVSRRLFESLPDEEKAFWHSHVHEVKSGQLVAPGIPGPVERELMEKLVDTYGKTWHTWHTDEALTLPLGVPQLMMGFTADGQADPEMVARRDRTLGIDSADKRRERTDIPAPTVHPAADAWQRGRVLQLDDPSGQQQPHASHDDAATASPPSDGDVPDPRG